MALGSFLWFFTSLRIYGDFDSVMFEFPSSFSKVLSCDGKISVFPSSFLQSFRLVFPTFCRVPFSFIKFSCPVFLQSFRPYFFRIYLKILSSFFRVSFLFLKNFLLLFSELPSSFFWASFRSFRFSRLIYGIFPDHNQFHNILKLFDVLRNFPWPQSVS